MVDRRRVNRFLRTKLRAAGRQYEQARNTYREGRDSVREEIPPSGIDRARIVCRRYAEKRAVDLDSEQRPACYEADHPDCEGCVEDLHSGTIETW